LPQMPGCLIPHIEILGISHVKGVEGLRQRVRFHRHTDEMNMVSHQTIGPYLQGIFRAIRLKPLQVLMIILIPLKDLLPVIASLRDMMGMANCHCTCAILGMNNHRLSGFKKSRK